MLILLPTFLSETNRDLAYLPPVIGQITPTLDGLIAESMKEALVFLKQFPLKVKPHHLPVGILDEHSKPDDLEFLMEPLVKGETWGLISDAGLPCIADPGSQLVRLAREKGIPVRAIPGPSSIPLALMLSGLPSQSFSFRGYLPKEPKAREERIKELERLSKKERSLQLFIEAPYRNEAALDSLIKTLEPETWLSVCKDLLGKDEAVHTARVKSWRRGRPFGLDKSPALFLLLAN